MAQLEKEIAALLESNGMEWRSNVKLAEGIRALAIKTSIKEVKDSYLNTDRVKDAATCPVCEQNIKIHAVALTKSSCELLIKACKIDVGGQKYFHVQKDLDVPLNVGGGWAKLKHWGLIEPMLNTNDPTKSVQGMWCVTVKAMKFIGQVIKLPSKVYLYNSRLISVHRDEISIIDAVGDFNEYTRMMSLEIPNNKDYLPPKNS